MKKEHKKSFKDPSDFLKKIGLGLSIIIIFNLFVHLGLTLFYEAPEVESHCQENEYIQSSEVDTQQGCQKIGGKWKKDSQIGDYWCDLSLAPAEYIYSESIVVSRDSECYQAYEAASDKHSGNGFIIILVIFAVVITVGMFVRRSKAVSSGLIYGSLVLLISGIIRYWEGVEDVWKFVMLGIALAVLVYLGFRDMGEKSSHE